MKAFKAYDIRGIYGKEFNRDDVYRMGFFMPQLLDTQKILIGRDIRNSSEEIYAALVNGITHAGADVYTLGLATTPQVYWTTARYNFTASVQITASHNAREYNGMKISGPNAKPIGYDNGLSKLEELVEKGTVNPTQAKGNIYDFNTSDDYLAFLKQYAKPHQDLKLAVDCSNGMAGLYIKEFLGDKPLYLNENPDGNFPGHDPNPLVAENVSELKKAVVDHHCDLGIIFDGDADRVMFVDETGEFISPDLMIALMGHYFKDEANKTVIQDIRTSKAVGEYLSQWGFNMHTWRVGRAYAAIKLKEIDGLFGGELAGHYYFRDFYYSDSGIMAMLILLQVIQQFAHKGYKVSEIISRIQKYESSGEINFKIEQKKEAMEAVKDHFMKNGEPAAFFDFDGYRLEYPQWWFNIRPSNTEPYLRLIVEAENKELLAEKTRRIEQLIRQFN
ncbi:MAG: phosphomannomutase/phosphoglucomutase [Bacteroidales bacterium]|nr:phosphomannomutase/phosphoglucomutase [Bacteroidales bacterium]